MLDIFNIFCRAARASGCSSIDAFEDQVATSLSYAMRSPTTRPTAPRHSVTTSTASTCRRMAGDAGHQGRGGRAHDLFSGSDKPLLNENFTGRYGFNNQRRSTGATSSCRASASTGNGRRDDRVRRLRPVRGRHAERRGSPTASRTTASRRADGRQPGTGSNPELADALVGATASTSRRNARFQRGPARRRPGQPIDPDFEVPSQYRWNLGVSHMLPWDIELNCRRHLLAGQRRGALAGHPAAAGRHGAGRQTYLWLRAPMAGRAP